MFHSIRCSTALDVPRASMFHCIRCSTEFDVPQHCMFHRNRCSTIFQCSTEFDAPQHSMFHRISFAGRVAAAGAAAARWHEDNYRGILCIRLAQCRKLPCCVGEVLRVEVAHAVLCFPCQRCEQLRIWLAQCRKRPSCVGEILRLEVTHTALCFLCQRCEQLCMRLATIPADANTGQACRRVIAVGSSPAYHRLSHANT